MSTNWTTNQQKAIDIRNTNTLVSAAAGSGKTAVLVERVIKIVTDEKNPVHINDLLVATFTNAAAAEMRERIYSALQKKIEQFPESQFLRQQLVLLGQAQITTVHSFCINLLRENFHRIGIRHDFDIADEIRLSSMKNSAMETVFENHYVQSDVNFLKTVDAFGGKKSDTDLVDIILKLSVFCDSLAYPDRWLEDCCTGGKSISEYRSYVDASLKESLGNIISEYEKAIECIKNDEGILPYLPMYVEEYDGFKKLFENFEDRKIAKNVIDNIVFSRLGAKKKTAQEDNVAFVKRVRTDANKEFKNIKEMYLYSDEKIVEELKLMNPFVETLCTLTREFREEYQRLKAEENVMDFADLEHYSIRLLDENEDVRTLLKNKYVEILVDEYQDTNAVQAHLFELLSNGNNLFMVGDVKQSIYSFRNSNPAFFVDKYNNFDFDGNNEGTKILLSQNFRSSNGVLGFVNSIFSKIMSTEAGGVDYNEEHALVYGNDTIKDINCSAEVHIIDPVTETSTELDEDEMMLDKARVESIFVANSIINLVEKEKTEIFDKAQNKYRPVTYRDICVLMRKTKGVASVYADTFASRGIPVFTEETGGYFNSIEIATVMSFLKIIENPLQDIPMLAVMRSPIYSFDDNTIAKLRSENRNDSIYSMMKKAQNTKAENFIADLENLSELSKYNNVEYIVRKIVFDTGYYQFVGGLPDGEKRMANLRLLCERAGVFSRNGYKSILKFVRYVEDMLESEKEYSSAKMISENDNVVRIMTVHKSKGLEFPVVYLSNCGGNFNKMDLRLPYVFDSNLGIALNIVDMERRIKYVPYVKKAVILKKSAELISEEIRLLYVALTRAKYKLIITGTMDKAYKNYSLLSSKSCIPHTFKNENSYIQWISNVVNSNNVSLYSAEDVIVADRKVNGDIDLTSKDDGDFSEFYPDVDKILSFEYAYKNSRFVPSKKSISEIVELVDESVHLDSFKAKDSGLSSAQKGTVIHYVLQNIDLANVDSVNDINEQIEKMISNGMLEKEYCELIDTDAIFGFFSSEIGKRMLRSDKIYREFKFCVDVPSAELGYEDTDEKIMVQGVIDCCFMEEDGFVIIDYKTGSLKPKYQRQLELYRRCLELATGETVKETHIYPLI